MNQLTIIGNVTKDADVRTTPTGVDVCSFSVAVNEKSKKDKEDSTIFFKVTTWRKLAEICGKYVKKGMKVCVVGAVNVQTYTTNNGETRADLCVTANDIEFLTRVDGDNQHEQQREEESAPANSFTDVSAQIDDELPF